MKLLSKNVHAVGIQNNQFANNWSPFTALNISSICYKFFFLISRDGNADSGIFRHNLIYFDYESLIYPRSEILLFKLFLKGQSYSRFKFLFLISTIICYQYIFIYAFEFKLLIISMSWMQILSTCNIVSLVIKRPYALEVQWGVPLSFNCESPN